MVTLSGPTPHIGYCIILRYSYSIQGVGVLVVRALCSQPLGCEAMVQLFLLSYGIQAMVQLFLLSYRLWYSYSYYHTGVGVLVV